MKRFFALTFVLCLGFLAQSCLDSLGVTEDVDVVPKNEGNVLSTVWFDAYMTYDGAVLNDPDFLKYNLEELDLKKNPVLKLRVLHHNVSDRPVLFKSRLRIHNIDNDKSIYYRTCNVDRARLNSVDEFQGQAIVNIVDVEIVDGKYEITPIELTEALSGVPPGGWVLVEFPYFEPNLYMDDHVGEMTISAMAEHTDPETGLEFDPIDSSDDELKYHFSIIK